MVVGVDVSEDSEEFILRRFVVSGGDGVTFLLPALPAPLFFVLALALIAEEEDDDEAAGSNTPIPPVPVPVPVPVALN